MPITMIKTVAELNAAIAKGPVVIDAFATWCPPCKMIAPKYEAMSNEFTAVTFLKLDVDEAGELAAHLKIQAMPTFIFYKGGAESARVQGASEPNIRAELAKLA